MGLQNKASHLMQQMESVDTSLKSLKQEMGEICLHLSEVTRSLISYTSKLEADPNRFAYFRRKTQNHRHPKAQISKSSAIF